MAGRRVLIWEPNQAEINALGQHPAVAGPLAEIGQKYKAEVERVAPRGVSEDYAGSIVMGTVGVREGTTGLDVGSDDFAAHIVEFGSVNNPPYRPLHRGAQNLGLRVED